MPTDEDSIIFATASYDHTIRLWQAHSGLLKRVLQHTDSQVNAMAISPDKRTLAAAGFQTVRLYDLVGNHSQHFHQFESLPKNVSAIGYNKTGRWMHTGGEDGNCRIWDIRDNSSVVQCSRTYKAKSIINTVALNPVNEHQVFIGDSAGHIYLWDLRSERDNQLHFQPDPLATIRSIAVNNEGSYFAALLCSGKCHVWSIKANPLETAIPRLCKEAHKSYGLKCEFSPDNTLLATCGADKTVNVFKTADFSLLRSYTHNDMKWVWDCAFSADSQFIITGSSEGLGRLWCVETGQIKREYKGHTKAITCIAFRDDSMGSR